MKKLAFLLALIFSLLPAAALAEYITVFNWYDYIDESVISEFEKETGIEIKYANFTTNEEMYAKLSTGAGEYDVIFPSDYIVERMLAKGELAELNLDNIPNRSYVMDWLQAPAYDPTGAHSVPYMWGTVGILYNTDLVDVEVNSWQNIFDLELAGEKSVFMLDSIRDSLGVALCSLGYSLNTRDAEELEAAKQVLMKQRAEGIVKGYLVDETKDKMISGEAALAVMWSGDAGYAIMEGDGNLAYVVPEEGSNVWIDAMCIPAASQKQELAEQFINFLCRPDVAARNREYIYYHTPIQQVADEMDEEEKQNPAFFADQAIIDRCEFFHDIADEMEMYDRIWMEIRG